MQSTERWKPVVGYEGMYEVSDHGNVRGVDRIDSQNRLWRGRELKPKTHSGGYLCVNLWSDGKGRMKYIHRLVLESHVGPPPDGKPEACHNDGDQLNNALANLRWGSPSDNALDRVKHGTHTKSSRTHCPRNHPLAPPNLVNKSNGYRSCLACSREWSRVGYKGLEFSRASADAYFAVIIADGK